MAIFVNNKLLNTSKFPGGECHIKIDVADIGNTTEIRAFLKNSDDIICLMLAVDAIRRVNAYTVIHLIIPYFPYARQDRVCNKGEALSVKVMANIINNLHCAKVTIYDPHSDVIIALLNNCHVISLADIIINSELHHDINVKKLALVSPDAGAEKKAMLVANRLSTADHVVELFCSSKKRDALTGNIIFTEVHGNFQGKNLLIIDDICDGGDTLINLAHALKEGGANDLYLYVTHGIFANGLIALAVYFKHVYCYHTILGEEEVDAAILTVL